MRALTDAQVQRALALVAAGRSTDEVAAVVGCSDTTIRTLRKRHGLSAPTGRQPWRAPQLFVCRQCGGEFQRKVQPSRPSYEFCKRVCHLAYQRDQRRKLPDDAAALYDLYVVQRLTTIEIAERYGSDHKSVWAALDRHGISRRQMGPRTESTCCEAECVLPIYRVKHKTNGSWYGKRCRLHWIVFRMMVNQRYNDKRLGKDEAWLRRLRQLLARVQRINREVSQSLKPVSKPATTSHAACPR